MKRQPWRYLKSAVMNARMAMAALEKEAYVGSIEKQAHPGRRSNHPQSKLAPIYHQALPIAKVQWTHYERVTLQAFCNTYQENGEWRRNDLEESGRILRGDG